LSGAPDALVDFHTGGKLKEDKAGKNSNPDVNVTLRAFDPSRAVPNKIMVPSADVESA